MRYLLSRAVAPGKSFELAKAYYAGWLHAPYKPATVPFVDDAATWSTYELAEQASKEVPAGESCVWVVVSNKPTTTLLKPHIGNVTETYPTFPFTYPIEPAPFLPAPVFRKN